MFAGTYEECFWGSMRKFRKVGSYNFYLKYRERFGDTFVVYFGRAPRVYTSDADLFKKVYLRLWNVIKYIVI